MAAHKSLTDFALDAAYQAVEQTLLDQRLFTVSGSQYQALMDNLGTARAQFIPTQHEWPRQIKTPK